VAAPQDGLFKRRTHAREAASAQEKHTRGTNDERRVRIRRRLDRAAPMRPPLHAQQEGGREGLPCLALPWCVSTKPNLTAQSRQQTHKRREEAKRNTDTGETHAWMKREGCQLRVRSGAVLRAPLDRSSEADAAGFLWCASAAEPFASRNCCPSKQFSGIDQARVLVPSLSFALLRSASSLLPPEQRTTLLVLE
jgi:hypothetical protein